MAKASKTYYAILGMLSIAPMSGYEIRQFMQQSTANFWSESDGQLYPSLAKLTKLGLISCEVEKASTREKKTYHITSEGITELKKWLVLESETHIIRNEFMLKLFFGANVVPQISLEHIQALRYQTKAMLSQLTETKKRLGSTHKESPHLFYWQMSLQYGIELTEAKLKWCNDVINRLENINRG